MLTAFYNELWDYSGTEEDHLAAALYGPGSSRKLNAYKKLKQRALEDLSGQIILVGSNSSVFTPDQRGFYRAHREYVVAELLRARNFKDSAAYFHRRALSKARKYQIISLQVLCLEALAYHAGVQDRNLRLFKTYNREYRLAFDRMIAERDVVNMFIKIKLIESTSPAARQKKHQQAVDFIRELDRRYSLGDLGHRYAFTYFTIKLEGWMSISDHKMTLRVADKAITFFTRLNFDRPVALSYFLMHKLMIYALRKDYENGVEVYEKCRGLLEEGLNNWYKFSELSIFLFLQTGRYNRAAALYTDFCTRKPLAAMPPRFREKWRVHRAYLHYLQGTGLLEDETWKDPEGTFRINKFLNSVPLFSSDKRGRNVPVLVIQILFTLQQHDFATAVDRIEAIEKYTTRHLRKDESYRSNCFIRLLLLFPKCNFRYKDIDSRSKTWLRKLNENPIELANQSFELEIIPYENLFRIALASLR